MAVFSLSARKCSCEASDVKPRSKCDLLGPHLHIFFQKTNNCIQMAKIPVQLTYSKI